MKLSPRFVSDFLEPATTVDLLNDTRAAYTETEPSRNSSFKDEFSDYFNFNLPKCFYDGPSGAFASVRKLAPIEAQMVARLNNCLVLSGTGLVIVNQNKVIADVFGNRSNFNQLMSAHGSYFGFRNGEFHMSAHDNPSISRDKHLDKYVAVSSNKLTAVLLSIDTNDQCLSHWLHLVCYRIFRSRNFLSKKANLVFVSTTALKDWQVEFFRLLFPEFGHCKIETVHGATSFDTVLLPIQTWDSWYNGEFWNFLNRSRSDSTKATSTKRRIFISRDDANSRRLSVEGHFSNLLIELGFETVVLTQHSVPDQINMLFNAEFIIIINGSHANLAPFFNRARGVAVIWNSEVDADYPYLISTYISNFLVVEGEPLSKPSHPNDDLKLGLGELARIKKFFLALQSAN